MARNGNHTKELIARTALKLFVAKGIAETTVRDIAAAAGLAEGTLYRHFESKEELAWELFHTNYTAFAQELDRLQREYETLHEKLTAMIRQFCTFFDRDPVLFSYLLHDPRYDIATPTARRRRIRQAPHSTPHRPSRLHPRVCT